MSGAIGAIAGIAGSGLLDSAGGVSEQQFEQAAAEAGISILMNTVWPLIQDSMSDAQADEDS